jgi:hypothetical protein
MIRGWQLSLDGHVTLEVEYLDHLYLNGPIGKLAAVGRLVGFMRGQLQKPIPSPVGCRADRGQYPPKRRACDRFIIRIARRCSMLSSKEVP